ncbi:hypothetical protein DDB_G0280595 [Dictyostelium discoideum AX4]|uniref:NADH dehydrogenase [ubiquinone] 1 beta subcomplex subunit 7 n=1 Tax=Dictyostelium discoideum TaxID=44689 RepID=NDUB7_DICDI|nr:hypothetical protein DDB_G0280595 [Dictyostelium discoideum AX4]Q54V61.1 RecName: Full=NADH dehydrogenase [ubiquinone] 1 beta subcomplex subunit 7 [Dictyostelium discoideum]EAL67099.1 hypothetical protein DDB_G0280595 [Dictyostelium discoideum AX4]|eukprot:XP_641070.1 hypothetical protein DDB_G0280595 [Dictyostelium discoideum AX4]
MTGHAPESTFNADGSRKMIATQQQCEDKNLPLSFRDYCAHLLIPLNDCRVSTYYAPWKCMDEKHAYEGCQYDEYLYRKIKKSEQDEAERIKREVVIEKENPKDRPYEEIKLS